MKKLVIAILAIAPIHAFADTEFIHPMDFDGSESQKEKVIDIIKSRVRN
jgi:hypothetical protein